MAVLVWGLTLYLPILLAMGLAFRPGQRLQRPWTFVLVAPAFGYGLAVMSVLGVEAPLSVLHILVIPTLETKGLDLTWWSHSVRWFNNHSGLLHLIVGISLSTASTVLIFRRWPQILKAVVT